MLPMVDSEACSKADERACLSIVRIEEMFDVLVADMLDKAWAMALRSLSLMFWLQAACTMSLCNGFRLLTGSWAVSRNVERIRR